MSKIPGPNKLIAGDLDRGFYGEVPSSELISGKELAELVGVTQGTSQFSDVNWLKWAYKGKVLFRPKKAIRYSISWDHLNEKNLVYGDRMIEVNGIQYKIRLMKSVVEGKGTLESNWSNIKNSEWNHLMLPIHIKAKDGSWAYPQYVEDDVPYWGIDYTDKDLQLGSGNGRAVWCQEHWDSGSAYRINRGGMDASYATYDTSSYKTEIRGWAPVLELLAPPHETIVPEITDENKGQVFSSSDGTQDDGADFYAFTEEKEDPTNAWKTCFGSSGEEYIGYNFLKPTIADAYQITVPLEEEERYPTSFELQGSKDGKTNFITLDKQEGIIFESGSSEFFEINSPDMYRSYRLLVKGSVGGECVAVQYLEIFDREEIYLSIKGKSGYLYKEEEDLKVSPNKVYTPLPVAMDEVIEVDNQELTVKEWLEDEVAVEVCTNLPKEEIELKATFNTHFLKEDLLHGEDVEVLVMHEKEDTPVVDAKIKPKAELLLADGDINIKSVEEVKKVTVVHESSQNAEVKMIVSIDKGETWQAFNGGMWIDVEPTKEDVLEKGTPVDVFNSISSKNWNRYRGDKDQVRFGYLLNFNEGHTTVQSIGMLYDAHGEWESVYHGEYYDYKYVDNSTLVVKIKKSGDYKINY